MNIFSKIFRIFIFVSTMFFFNLAIADEWNTQFGTWSCNGKTGAMPNVYNPDDETIVSNMNVANSEYDMLCTFTYPFVSGSDNYVFSIAFPSCKFDSDNMMITIGLTLNSAPLDSTTYKIGFPSSDQTNSYLTADEINRDQNAKMAFFSGIISNNSLSITSTNLSSAAISLDGLHQGIQSPYCNK